MGTSYSAGLAQNPDGIFTADPDDFRENGRLDTAEINFRPRPYDGKPIHPASLWLHANVRLPISFSEVNRIDIKTTSLSIRPMFPGLIPPAADDVYEVEFDRASGSKDGPVPREGGSRLEVRGSKPLVLSNVSPGEYWIRIYHPGAVLEPRKRITVSATWNSYEAGLKPGACLVIPIEWPELREPQKLPPEIARSFVWFSPDLNDSLRTMLVLKRKDGSVVEELGRTKRKDGSYSDDVNRMPLATSGRFPNAAVFPCLPPGEYVVESPGRTIEATGVNPGCVIGKSSVTVTIPKNGPVYVTSEPLKILYSRKD